MNIGNISAAIFSPAKVAYYGFLLALYFFRKELGAFPTCLFFWVTGAFLVVEIGHNDWLRIILNNCADRGQATTVRVLKDIVVCDKCTDDVRKNAYGDLKKCLKFPMEQRS